MNTIENLWNTIIHPRKTSRKILEEKGIRSSLMIVLGFSLAISILFYLSHLVGAYPPPPETMKIWIEAYGEFGVLPFIKVPPENYRLLQAIFFTPMTIAIWMLMAGSANLLSILFGGKGTYEQYLKLFGFTFYSFWIIASILDTLYSNILGSLVLQALKMEYGILARNIAIYFPQAMWITTLSLGGAYNAIATHELEHFTFPKTAIIGITTLFWPIILIIFLIR